MSEAPGPDWWGDDPARLAELDRDYPLERHERRDPVAAMRAHVRPLRPAVRVRSRAYRAQLPRQASGVVHGRHAEVLARAGDARALVIAAQVTELEACVDWAALHDEATHADTRHGRPADGGEQLVALAGPGAPLVAEFCIPELALRLGVSTDSGRALMTDALELAHRLPACWAALRAGGVPVFRARRVAQATRDLNTDAAALVDREVAPYLHGIGVTALDAIVEHATWAHDLDRALGRSRTALERRGIRIDLGAPRASGADPTGATVDISGALDTADAIELDRVLTDLAHRLLLAGSTETLDVRRSQALGMLARHETLPAVPDPSPAPDLEEWDPEPEPAQPGTPRPTRRRHVVLHVHLSEAALTGAAGLARLEGLTGPVSTEQVRRWWAAPGSTTHVTVRPVLDLGAHLTSPGYTPAADLAEQVVTRDRTCVFPHCTTNARTCDLDHVVPHADDPSGGATTSDNLAALCRRHHRLKTHHPGWSYRVLHPGTYLWTTPRGQRLLRDPAGTHPL